MQIKKELIWLGPLSFERIEDYMTRVLQLKLVDYWKYFPKKDSQLIELILINLKTLYDVLCLTFHASWTTENIMARIIPLIPFVAFLLRIGRNCLMKGNTRSSNMPIWWMEKVNRIIEKEVDMRRNMTMSTRLKRRTL